MEQREWSVTVNRADEKISIKRRGLRFIRPKPTETEIIAQGAWVAKGWHAMLDKENRPNRPLRQRGCEADFKLAC